MESSSTSTFSAGSYAEAKTLAKKTGKVQTFDSGDGWIGRAEWCSWRKRVIVTSTKNGVTI